MSKSSDLVKINASLIFSLEHFCHRQIGDLPRITVILSHPRRRVNKTPEKSATFPKIRLSNINKQQKKTAPLSVLGGRRGFFVNCRGT
jgi:hypothetical protein